MLIRNRESGVVTDVTGQDTGYTLSHPSFERVAVVQLTAAISGIYGLPGQTVVGQNYTVPFSDARRLVASNQASIIDGAI